jgi:hypothetical protein
MKYPTPFIHICQSLCYSSTLSANQFLVHVVDLLADIMHEDLHHQELIYVDCFKDA